MNTKILPIVVVIGVIVIILSAFLGAGMGSVFATNVAADDDYNTTIKIRSMITDKDIYHSNEEMKIVLSLYSAENISGVVVNVSGIENKWGKDLVSFSKSMNVTSGENEMTFTSKLPSCSPCAGIGLGTYFINVSVSYDDEVVNATHCIAITPKPNQITHVNIVVEEAKRMIESESEDVTLLDVRTEEEFNSAHISGAILIPVSELSNKTEELNKSKKIVVYCRSGHRSAIASDILIENGFERVYNVFGGINAWEESDYSVVSTTTPIPKQPGFGAVIAIAGLLVVAYWIKRRKVSL